MFANKDGQLDFSGAAQNDRIVVSSVHPFWATALGETSCQAMNTVPRKWAHAYEQH